MTVYNLILILSTLCLVETKSQKVSRKAERHIDIDNIYKTENQLWDDNQPSRTRCMASCLRNVDCKSFAHNSKTGRCQGFSRNYRGQTVSKDVIQDGIMHYDIVDDDCELLGPVNNATAEDCAEIQTQGFNSSGVYTIVVGGITKQVWCDLQTDGGRWTVIQRRKDGSVDFDVGWNEYKAGFGDASQEYWIGNDALFALTSNATVELLILMERWNGVWLNATYSSLRVNDESDKYRLTVSGYSGTAGDSLSYHNGQRFSTIYQDNDASPGVSCNPTHARGGWWFNRCGASNLNGKYYDSPILQQLSCYWYHISYECESLKTVFMMIRQN